MKITDIVSVTELSKILNKSRPTVYKYVSDFERGEHSAIPHSVKRLFLQIQSGNIPKREIYAYGDYWFASGEKKETKKQAGTSLKDIFKLLKDNEKKLDLTKVKAYIEEAIKNEG